MYISDRIASPALIRCSLLRNSNSILNSQQEKRKQIQPQRPLGDLIEPECPEPVPSYGRLRCSQELAYEIIIRDLPTHLTEEFNLISANYDGEAFLLVASEYESVYRALNKLRDSLELHKPRVKHVRCKGSADDLKDVEFSEQLDFLGAKECVFCGCSFNPGEIVRRTPCLHVFHSACLSPWLQIKTECPLDKTPI